MTTPYAPLMEPQERAVTLDLDPVDALRLINRLRRVSFYVRTSVDLVTDRDEESTMRYPSVLGPVPMTLSTAQKMMRELIGFNQTKAEDGQKTGKVIVTRLGCCLFVG